MYDYLFKLDFQTFSLLFSLPQHKSNSVRTKCLSQNNFLNIISLMSSRSNIFLSRSNLLNINLVIKRC